MQSITYPGLARINVRSGSAPLFLSSGPALQSVSSTGDFGWNGAAMLISNNNAQVYSDRAWLARLAVTNGGEYSHAIRKRAVLLAACACALQMWRAAASPT